MASNRRFGFGSACECSTWNVDHCGTGGLAEDSLFHVEHCCLPVKTCGPTLHKVRESKEESIRSESMGPMKPRYFFDHWRSGNTALTRREALKGTLALAAASVLSGCGSSSSGSGSTTTPPPNNSNPQPAPSGPMTQASMSVIATSIGSIGPAFAGLSYEKSSLYESPYLFTSANDDLIGLFQRLGPSVLRVGGNSVDRNVWTPNGAGQTAGQIAPSDVAALAGFVKAAGWQCLYGINLGGAGPNPYTSGSIVAATTPALAAAEVAYVASQFGSSLLGIEIGNECDLYGSTYFSGATWNLSTFEALWAEFRAAIVAQTPIVNVTGPADAGNESSWTVPFGQWATKSNITLLTQHYYRGNGQSASSTAANLVTPDPNIVSDLATLDAGATGIGVPFRMSECNSYYNGGADGVSDAYCSSLWVIDFLFDCAIGGSVGTNFHGGGDGDGYTPIADSGGAVVEARPEYYGILFFTLAGQGELYTTSLSGIGSLNVTAYAVKTASGGLSLVIVNKDSMQNLQMTVQLPQSAPTATLLEMTQLSSGATGPSLSATSGVTIQGASIGVNGSLTPGAAYTLSTSGSRVTCYVPALSAVLIQIVEVGSLAAVRQTQRFFRSSRVALLGAAM
jgi:hypothetical protein